MSRNQGIDIAVRVGSADLVGLAAGADKLLVIYK